MRFVPRYPDSLRPRKVTIWGRPRGFRLAAIILGFLSCLAGAALLGVRLSWPQPSVSTDPSALARVQIASVGERVAGIQVVDSAGHPVPVALRSGAIVPTVKIRPGLRVKVDVTVRRVGWLGWLVGGTKHEQIALRTPSAQVAAAIVRPEAGGPVRVAFSRPVSSVTVEVPPAARQSLTFDRPRRNVPIGILATGSTAAGTLFIAGAPRRWERPPAAVRVNWFPAGETTQALVRPAPNTPSEELKPSQPIVLTFSRPVSDVLGTKRPRLWPATPGLWRQPTPHMLVFQPSGTGFTLGSWVHVVLPDGIQVSVNGKLKDFGTLVWHVPQGSPARVRQLFADLGYLPLAFKPADAAVPDTPAAQALAAVEPPAGTFTWRYAKTPAALKALWTSSEQATMMRGALMAFELTHGMTADGLINRSVWRALLNDELAGRHAPYGYSYVYVSEALPQTLTLWQQGHVVLRTPVNTGISSRPTDLGTFPVYLHLTSTTMSGTNPDGTPYHDPGVPWVNYFNGGDAVHGFYRPGYGYPQSLGCVEVQPDTAALIFPHVQIGTLVTVAS